ncbi:hypothetical protein [Cryobacterium sp. CG_9.6]|uniref:hypothetical protein n=1 Tax=Cryobacterium sp. CG_9.6 TaxID=2760710 RepID=UPI0024770297|nr:hypothetical protein [Cryobacterium sp. CG_9.6]MDH6235322.1 hypothetical protein [Cryobacterium sp. CG_9.6]
MAAPQIGGRYAGYRGAHPCGARRHLLACVGRMPPAIMSAEHRWPSSLRPDSVAAVVLVGDHAPIRRRFRRLLERSPVSGALKPSWVWVAGPQPFRADAARQWQRAAPSSATAPPPALALSAVRPVGLVAPGVGDQVLLRWVPGRLP